MMSSKVTALEPFLHGSGIELRGDGSAGSGLVLVMQSIAAAAVAESTLHVQQWPLFSSARKGAPTRAFLRVSRHPIEKSSPITRPQVVLCMDPGVTASVDFAEGITAPAVHVVNTSLSPQETAARYRLRGLVYTIDGTAIAAPHMKKPLGNIPIFAVLMEILPGFEAERAREQLRHILIKSRLPQPLIEANLAVYTESLGQARHADCQVGGTKDHRPKTFLGYGELMPGAQSRLRLSRTNLTSAYARAGFTLHFADPEGTCNGCGHCIINCPENIIHFQPDEERGVRVTGADVSHYCKLCRECIAVCPKQLFSEVVKS